MRIGLRLVKIASVYMMIGLFTGLGMGISGNFALTSAHAHTLLLGWATMALAGLIYIVLPDCSRGRLAQMHFWGHNVGLPAMISGLALLAYGVSAAEKLVAASSTLVLLSLGVFAVNIMIQRALPESRWTQKDLTTSNSAQR